MRVRVRGGRWLLATALLGLVVTLTAVAPGRAPAPLRGHPAVARPAKAPRLAGEAAALRPVDPAGIRDVFRFADGAAARRPRGGRGRPCRRRARRGAPPAVRASSAWCGGPAA